MTGVVGVGIDAVDIDRFREVLARRPRIRERIFTQAERRAVEGRSDPVPGLAARYAAKEAGMKALSVGIGGVDFADIEVISLAGGAPLLRVSGRALELAVRLGINRWHVSLSHTDSLATAIVVAD